MDLVGPLFFDKCQDVHHRPDKVAAVNESAPPALEPRAAEQKYKLHRVEGQHEGGSQQLLHRGLIFSLFQWQGSG